MLSLHNFYAIQRMKLPVGYVPGIGVHKPTAYGGFGEKLLKQLGWSDGKGLGAQGTGITSALRVLKKEDTIGVCLLSS